MPAPEVYLVEVMIPREDGSVKPEKTKLMNFAKANTEMNKYQNLGYQAKIVCTDEKAEQEWATKRRK